MLEELQRYARLYESNKSCILSMAGQRYACTRLLTGRDRTQGQRASTHQAVAPGERAVLTVGAVAGPVAIFEVHWEDDEKPLLDSSPQQRAKAVIARVVWCHVLCRPRRAVLPSLVFNPLDEVCRGKDNQLAPALALLCEALILQSAAALSIAGA